MTRLPIRTRLTIILVGLQALLALVFAGSVYWFFSMEHLAEEDRNLRDKLHALQVSYHLADGRATLSNDQRSVRPLWADTIVHISSLEGTVLYCNLPEDTVHIPLGARVKNEADAVDTVRLPDGAEYRVAWCVDRHHGVPVVISAAVSLDRLKAEQRELVRVMLRTTGGVLLLSAVLAWYTVGRLLQPLKTMTHKLRRITADRLSERLTVYNSNDEIGELTATLNHMMDRLHAALSQAQRFGGDASHELRTPLTSIRTELESVMLHSDLPHECAESVGSALEELERLLQLLDVLLTLAHMDAGRVPLVIEQLDVCDLISSTVERLAVQAVVKGGKVVAQVPTQPCLARGDRRLLEQVLLNLIGNALKYGGPEVTVTCERTGHDTVLCVHDSGPGIPPEHLPRLCDRFYCVDKSRSRALGGCGLGLSLTKEWVEMHGGTIDITSPSNEGTTVTVRLPHRRA